MVGTLHLDYIRKEGSETNQKEKDRRQEKRDISHPESGDEPAIALLDSSQFGGKRVISWGKRITGTKRELF